MNTDKLSEIYEKYNNSFYSRLHTALYRILVDNVHDGKLGCFVPAKCTSEGWQLGFSIANEPGYIPLPAYFIKSIGYDEAMDMAEDMNMIAFGINPAACSLIMISSMRKKEKQTT
jgi:hypothetical protein